jgi:hypothetical protein
MGSDDFSFDLSAYLGFLSLRISIGIRFSAICSGKGVEWQGWEGGAIHLEPDVSEFVPEHQTNTFNGV